MVFIWFSSVPHDDDTTTPTIPATTPDETDDADYEYYPDDNATIMTEYYDHDTDRL